MIHLRIPAEGQYAVAMLLARRCFRRSRNVKTARNQVSAAVAKVVPEVAKLAFDVIEATSKCREVGPASGI